MPVRKITAGYSNLTARVPSLKLNRMTDAESSLERDFLFLLEMNNDVIHFEEQPMTIKFRGREYTPDVLVHYRDGQKVIYEVKYRSEMKKGWSKFKPKFKAALNYAKNRGMKFKIITEIEIRTPLLKNLEFLSHFSRTISDTETPTKSLLLNTLLNLTLCSPKELLAACFSCKIKRAEAAPVLWRLIYSGDIQVNLELPLNMYTQLQLSHELSEAL